MAADMNVLQGEVTESPASLVDVEKLLASFLEALVTEQKGSEPK